MNRQDKIAQLELNSFAFEVDLTLDELEWTRMLGRNGFGYKLLEQIIELGSPYFDIDAPKHAHNGTGELLSFELDGRPYELRLSYNQPFMATLLSGIRSVLDGVNRAMRRAALPVRYVCVRDSCTGAGCTYRIMLMPPAWMDDVRDEYTVVAGLCPEDYESTPPLWQPGSDEDFLELR